MQGNVTNIPDFQNKSIRVFFMTHANSIHLYPNEMEIVGDSIEVKVDKENWRKAYKTKISQNNHVQGDPRFKCSVYTEDHSYNDCVQAEVLQFFDKEIGCQPPLLVKDPTQMCNKRFNITNKDRIARFFKHLDYHDAKFKCRAPCLTNVFNTRFVIKAERQKGKTIEITFDNTVEVFHSSFRINEQTFLTRLGGSVSSGRTLLWIFLSLVGALQVGLTKSNNVWRVFASNCPRLCSE